MFPEFEETWTYLRVERENKKQTKKLERTEILDEKKWDYKDKYILISKVQF